MLEPTLTPYNQICQKCGKGREMPGLEYEGNGLFYHRKCITRLVVRSKKVYKEQTVPICLCRVGVLNFECPYREKLPTNEEFPDLL